MNIDTFFENLETLFEDQDDVQLDLVATLHRKNGKISEIRIYNEKYDDILIINNKGTTEAINIDEFKP